MSARSAASPGTGALFDRSKEIERLERALETTLETGTGSCVLLEGTAGMGKTSLLTAVTSSPAARPFAISVARASALESDFAFGLVRELFGRLLAPLSGHRRAGILDGPAHAARAVLSDLHAGLVGAGEAPLADDITTVLPALYSLTANLAADTPLLLVADDVHWSDEPSLRFFTYLAHRAETLPVLLVLAARPPSEWRAPAMRATLGREVALPVVALRPLSISGVEELVSRSTSAPAERAFAGACRQVTGGNPFYLVELLRTIVEQGVDPVAASSAQLLTLTPEGILLSMLERLGRLPPEAATVARALAVIGDHCQLSWVAELGALSLEDVASGADALRSVGILADTSELGFAHPILRSTLYGSVLAATRAGMHGESARIARRHDAPPEVVAAHLLRATPGALHWAAGALRAAAARALERGAPEAAMTYLRQALREQLDAGDRPRLLLELGSAEALARSPAAIEHLEEALGAGLAADGRLAAGLALWSTTSFDGRIADGFAMLRRVLATTGDGRSDLRERVELELARASRSLRSTAGEGRVRIDRLRRRSERMSPTLRRVSMGLVAYDAMLANTPATRVLELVGRALPLDDAVLGRSESQLLHLPLYTLIYCDALDWARRVLDEFEAATARRGSGIGTVIADLWRSLASLRSGALLEADQLASKVLAGATERGWLFGRAGAQLLLCEIALERGDARAAARISGSIEKLVGSDPDLVDKGWSDHMLHGKALPHLALGDATTALEILLEVGRRHDAWQARCPSELPWRSNAALCAHLLGDAARAESLASEEAALAHAFGAGRARGIALRVHGVVTGSEVSLREAVDVLANAPARLERARALCTLGRRLHERQRDREARSILRDAAAAAEEAGAQGLARRASAALRAAGGRRRPGAAPNRNAVSAAEHRTAHLAALGMSNPAIATTLFISRRTVEAHLYSVYKKLGIRSRAELAEALPRIAAAARLTSRSSGPT